MGSVITTIEVGDPQGRHFQSVEVEADTGSTYTALPRGMLVALGVPVQTSVQSRLADGSIQMVDIGQATIRLGAREFSTTVMFAEEGEPKPPGRDRPGRSSARRGPRERRTDPGGGQEILTGTSRPDTRPDGAVQRQTQKRQGRAGHKGSLHFSPWRPWLTAVAGCGSLCPPPLSLRR